MVWSSAAATQKSYLPRTATVWRGAAAGGLLGDGVLRLWPWSAVALAGESQADLFYYVALLDRA
jgi:hypothetical protein